VKNIPNAEGNGNISIDRGITFASLFVLLNKPVKKESHAETLQFEAINIKLYQKFHYHHDDEGNHEPTTEKGSFQKGCEEANVHVNTASTTRQYPTHAS
jgi:hypothetical protein